MKSEKIDRRIRKTRNIIRESLSKLMSEKEFKDITVNDIADLADINRGTFYLHYKDTYDLLDNIEDEIILDFQNMIDQHWSKTTPDTLMPILEPIASYIEENQAICRILFKNSANSNFLEKFTDLIFKNGYSIIAERFPAGNSQILDYYFTFITYGVVGQIGLWFDTDLAIERKELIELIDKIITSAAQSVLVPEN